MILALREASTSCSAMLLGNKCIELSVDGTQIPGYCHSADKKHRLSLYQSLLTYTAFVAAGSTQASSINIQSSRIRRRLLCVTVETHDGPIQPSRKAFKLKSAAHMAIEEYRTLSIRDPMSEAMHFQSQSSLLRTCDEIHIGVGEYLFMISVKAEGPVSLHHYRSLVLMMHDTVRPHFSLCVLAWSQGSRLDR